MRTYVVIILIWLGIALLSAWWWHRLRAHGKRLEEEMDKWTGKRRENERT